MGLGNGGFELRLTEETENEILTAQNHIAEEPMYEPGLGPVDVKVIDPRHLTQSDFALKLLGNVYSPVPQGNPRFSVLDEVASKWELVNLTTSESYVADANLSFGNQQLFPDLGFSIEIEQSSAPTWDYDGDSLYTTNKNGFVSSSIEFEDEYNPWLGGVRDVDEDEADITTGNTYLWGRNWIHAGAFVADPASNVTVFNDVADQDPDAVYEDVVNGTWAPYKLVSYYKDGPAYDNNSDYNDGLPTSIVYNDMRNLQSVKVVFTSDKSKWSRCVVLESQDNPPWSEVLKS